MDIKIFNFNSNLLNGRMQSNYICAQTKTPDLSARLVELLKTESTYIPSIGKTVIVIICSNDQMVRQLYIHQVARLFNFMSKLCIRFTGAKIT